MDTLQLQSNTAMIAGVGCAMVAGMYLAKSALLSPLQGMSKTFIVDMLGQAGIIVGEDIEVLDEGIYMDWAKSGMMAIGESYMAGLWTTKNSNLDVVLYKLMSLPSDKKRKLFKSWNAWYLGISQQIFNYQSPSRAGIVGAEHYDIGNDFYKKWLDSNLQYSCAYWRGIEPPTPSRANLQLAQEQKLKLICDKLHLEENMTVLEVGCGWGGLAVYMAKNYRVHVTGITISNEQLKGAREWAEKEGVSHLTSFEYRDYREQTGQFDRVVSIAMLEAVGYQNMDEYYDVLKRCLKTGGLCVVHSIAANRSTTTAHQAWILKYIFPNGFLPSLKQMSQFSEKKFVVEDVHNLGPDYDKTLMSWNLLFQNGVTDGSITKPVVFKRMWEYYLCYCAAGFRARTIQLYQVVYSKHKAERYIGPR